MIIKVLYVIVLITTLFQFTLVILVINMEVSKNTSLIIKEDSLIISGIYAAAYIKESADFPAGSSWLNFQLLNETTVEIAVKEASEGPNILLKVDEETVYNYY